MSVGKVSEFNVKTGVWSSYIERLQSYFTVNNVSDELKLPTLIAVMGDEAYELLSDLASPRKPSEVTYKEAVDMLGNHLQPTPSALAERFRFRQRRQAADESVAGYVAELKKLTRYCKLGSNLAENLRDQFICGLRSDVIRQRLFAELDTLNFTYAVKIATSMEAAERDAAAVEIQGSAATRAEMHSLNFGGGSVGSTGSAVAGPRGASAGQRRGAGGAAARGGRGIASTRGPARNASYTARNLAGNGFNYGCRGCGAADHDYGTRRFRTYLCSRCKRTGHLRRVCPVRDAGTRGASLNYGDTEEAPAPEGEQDTFEEFHHLCLNDYKAVSLTIQIENCLLDMQVDTGTAVTCISRETYEKHFNHLPLEPSNIRLQFYNGQAIYPIGLIKPTVSYGKKKKCLELFIIEGGTTSLIGRQWLTELEIKIPMFSNCHNIQNNGEIISLDNELKQLFHRYKEVFSGGLGRYNGGKASLHVREGAAPVFHRARPLPYALRDRVDAALDSMLRDGVIEPVECSDWASPLVPVNKADGSLRICADYKATVNPVLIVDRYPLPKIDDLFVRLSGSIYYSKIDLSQAYNQVELDESKKYTVINTHRGLYQYNRLVYGLASSAGIFQRIMCNLLCDIPNVEVFLDDVIIGGRTKAEHLGAVEAVFSRLQKYGLKLRTDKCVFLVKEVRYLGYVLSREGVKTDPSKIEAISKIPRPNNVTELRSFLGLINFYAKFVQNMSGILVPLYELLKKERKWFWTQRCETAFREIKHLLTSAEVLAHYNPNLPLIVTCDASAKGVGAVLSQPDGTRARGERPVAYASRTLNEAEKNYSQIHREALAIIFAVNKFHQYLYGRHFILRTDHKPLVSIFGPHTGIPSMVASRMQRWSIILSAYTFDIEYVRTDENGADGLSRLPIVNNRQLTQSPPEQTYLHLIQEALLLDYNQIKQETAKDPLLSRVLGYVRDGSWPAQCDITNLQPFFNRKKELYEELGCLLWGHRLVIPDSCKERVLKMIHEPHMGIVKSKALARSYVWWAGLDEAVERVCKECEVCAAHADAPPRQSPRMWPWPNRPWSRLHLDFMGPIFGKLYLVVIDATSKWIEVFCVTSTAATGVINKMVELFSRWGIPRQIVSDNGPPFTSLEFKGFANSYGIEHIFTAPYHPASNGLVENSVRILKRVIRKANHERQNIDRALGNFLLYYRNTEHSTTGEAPALLLLGRKVRTKLDILKPDREGKVIRAQRKQKENAGGGDRQLMSEEGVWYRQYLRGEKWGPGRIVGKLGPENYKVVNKEGEIIHRHIDQLKKRSSRLSFTCPGSQLGQESSTSSQNNSRLTEGSPSGEQSERAIETPARASAASPEPGSSTALTAPDGQAGAGAEPSSPDFQDALPDGVPPTPHRRPIRKCRLKDVDYKVR